MDTDAYGDFHHHIPGRLAPLRATFAGRDALQAIQHLVCRQCPGIRGGEVRNGLTADSATNVGRKLG